MYDHFGLGFIKILLDGISGLSLYVMGSLTRKYVFSVMDVHVH